MIETSEKGLSLAEITVEEHFGHSDSTNGPIIVRYYVIKLSIAR